MRKNIKIRVMCLIVAGIMLTGSLLVAAVNGSPYETLKNAIFDAMTFDNVTLEGHVTIIFNGEVYETDRAHFVFTETGNIEYIFDADGMPTGRFIYDTDHLEIRSNVFTDRDGIEWHSAWVTSWNWRNFRTGPMMGMGMTQEDRESVRFRFMELMIDLAVGDLKNHMTMSTSGGVRSITGTITHNQLPEIVRLGLDVIAEESQRWHHGDFGTRDDYFHPMDIPIRNIHFNRIHGDADVDADGNLLHLSGHIDMAVTNVFGDINTIEFIFELNFSDIGTSHQTSPIPGAVELLTPDFMEQQFNRRYGLTVYFTRNADGSINEDSITTTWPGQAPDTRPGQRH